MKGSLKRSMGKPFMDKNTRAYFELKGFPIVPMKIHRDTCSAGLLKDPIRCAKKSFFEAS